MLLTEFFREIAQSRNRFFSILLIVLLGTAFFAGVRASGPDMRLSADRYYDDSNLQDIRIVSTLGLTQEDADALGKVDGVKETEAGYSCDVFADSSEAEVILRFLSIPEKISRITVKEGRLPEKTGECLVDTNFAQKTGWKIGDTFSVTAPSGTTLSDELDTNTYTITGTGTTPLYLSLERGTSTIGSGVLSSYVYVPSSAFSMDAYTQITMTVKGASDLSCYSDAYDDLVKKTEDAIDGIEEGRCTVRYVQVQADGYADIEKGRSALDDARESLAKARQELDDARTKLTDGQKTIDDKEKELADAEETVREKQNTIDNGWQSYNDGYAQYEDGAAKIAENEQTLADGKEQLAAAKKKLADGESDYQTGLAKYNASLADWQKNGYDEKLSEVSENLTKAQDGLTQVKDGLSQAEEGLQQAKDGQAKAQEALDAFRAADDAGKAQMAAAQGMTTDELQAYLENSLQTADETAASLTEKITTLTAQEKELQSTVDTLTAAKKKLEDGKAALSAAKTQLSSARAKLDAGKKELAQNEQKITDGQAQLAEAKEQLAEAKEKLDASYQELTDGQAKLDDAKAELEDGRKKLADAKKELADNQKKYTDAKETYDAQIASAMQQIGENEYLLDDAQKQLEEMEKPTWYVLNRKTLMSYTEYGQNAERITAIGNVFPVIFFLVAALVCLTTMARMVEENRIQIGTLKALGYSNRTIAAKYLFYALFATLAGSLIGYNLGQKLLPYVIINAYKILYDNLPVILLPIHPDLSFFATAAAIGSTMAATIFACVRETRSVPAQLMRPQAPKSGRRILLEHITPLWKHLNFSNKATFRNLFRYKKRLFMTILGIGGCMGLLLTGFGLMDSIRAIGDVQFASVDHHNASVVFESDISSVKRKTIEDAVRKDADTSLSKTAMAVTLDVSAKDSDEKKSVYLVVPEDTENLSAFISMHDRITQKEYTLGNDGVILNEKLAKLLNVSPGDSFTVWKSDTKAVTVKVQAVMENYFYHYVYLTPSYYREVFGEEPEYNEIMVNLKDTSDAAREAFRTRLMKNEGISGINFISEMEDRMDNMLKSMDAIIYVIVIAAGALAFIVLYNLNNINIEERKRELATLKVLGFYEGEVSAYVMRENIWLTVIGCLLGVLFGILLHYYVIVTAEIEIMMFGRKIKAASYLMSIGLTFLFSALVSLVMFFRLKKINMVESMKSVE